MPLYSFHDRFQLCCRYCAAKLEKFGRISPLEDAGRAGWGLVTDQDGKTDYCCPDCVAAPPKPAMEDIPGESGTWTSDRRKK